MAEAVLMPKVGISVESCIITEWKKQPGDTVAAGDILFDYETDKSSLECESTAAGVLIEQFFGNGDEVPVLTAVCAIGAAGEDVSSLRPGGAEAAPAVSAAPAEPAPAAAVAQPAPAEAPAAAQPVPAPAPAIQDTENLKISPRAKALAEKQGVNPALATPTGPYGRVIERDVRAALAAGSGIGGRVLNGEAAASTGIIGEATATTTIFMADKPFVDEKFTGIRRAISKSMSASLAEIPQLTHNFSFDASEIMAYRAKIKQSGEELGLPNISLNDIILFVVSRILPKYPELNAHMLDGTTIRKFSDVNLGMAVDTPRGLMVPKIMQANRKSLAQISAEAKALARAAQEGSINPDALSGGTFTVSNLGAFGVESFTPVINPPETGILGVDNIVERPRRAMDGGIELYPAMGVSLTYDHRAIDGAPASRFAKEVCNTLEKFTLLLAM